MPRSINVPSTLSTTHADSASVMSKLSLAMRPSIWRNAAGASLISPASHCPGCGHDWQPVFDIARFLWQELHAWALHMLREVDTLAASYHWAEADILALSPRRRQAYLELCAP